MPSSRPYKTGVVAFMIVLLTTIALASERLPDLTLTDVDHRPIHLDDLRGRIVLLDLCASWCIVCRQSLPFYAELQRRHRDAVTVVALSIDADEDDARAFARTLPPEIRLAHDASGDAKAALGMGAMPSLLIVDREGRIRHRHESFRPEDRAVIEKLVDELISEPVRQ